MKKQSPHDRKKRLDEGRCPIHGLWMSQVGLIEVGHCSECGAPTKLDVVVGCPRRDCTIVAYTHAFDGERRLPKDLEHILL